LNYNRADLSSLNTSDEHLENLRARHAGVYCRVSSSVYERLIAGTSAVIVVGAVAYGFLLRPEKEAFVVRTTLKFWNEGHFTVEHQQIAVKVELARLWLLFLPTIVAVGFLVATAARGTTWSFSLFGKGRIGQDFPAGFYIFRALLFFMVGTLSAWISERWVLRDAEARSLRSLSVGGRRVSYAFVDASGGYYGGEGLIVGKVRSKELASLVVYRTQKPEVSKTPLTCLFHKFVVIGQGLTDLDKETASKLSMQTVPARTPS
jgi:hypothetical protein